MSTRFEDEKNWRTSASSTTPIVKMDLNHLLNTYKLLITEPLKVQSMLLTDIETSKVWGATTQSKTQSVYNITSLSLDEVANFLTKSPLFNTICEELFLRGVNLPQYTRNTFSTEKGEVDGHWLTYTSAITQAVDKITYALSTKPTKEKDALEELFSQWVEQSK